MLNFGLDDFVHCATLAAILFGLIAVQLRSSLSPAELFSVGSQCRFREKSALITYVCALILFISTAYLEGKMLHMLFYADPQYYDNLPIDIRRAIYYLVKACVEVCFIGLLVVGHQQVKAQFSMMAVIVALISFIIMFVHLARLFDRVIFQTNFLSGVYSPLLMGLNVSAVISMAFYIPLLSFKEKQGIAA